MLPLPPDSIVFSIGPVAIRWYGLLYAVGLYVAYRFMVREAKRRRLDAELIANGLIIISIAALAGGRPHGEDSQQARGDELDVELAALQLHQRAQAQAQGAPPKVSAPEKAAGTVAAPQVAAPQGTVLDLHTVRECLRRRSRASAARQLRRRPAARDCRAAVGPVPVLS